MKKYPKIQTVFNRDGANNFKTVIYGEFSMPEFGYLCSNIWVATEKVDGTNIRVMYTVDPKPMVRFAGKSDDSSVPTFLLRQLEVDLPVERFAEHFDHDVCLYGEGYGNKIQKVGKLYDPDGVNFILFDVRVGDVWLERSNVEDIAAKLHIETVPEICRGSLWDCISFARVGFQSKVGDCQAEGLVLRPAVELFNRMGNRIITKIKHRDFPEDMVKEKT